MEALEILEIIFHLYPNKRYTCVCIYMYVCIYKCPNCALRALLHVCVCVKQRVSETKHEGSIRKKQEGKKYI